jgi:uncharacterized heparinase superfamily protein
LFKKISRLYHTVKYLKIRQIIWRVIGLFPKLIFWTQTYPKVSQFQIDYKFVPRKGITQDYKTFTFLGETFNLRQVGWDNSKNSKLWRYNLHYFEFLSQEAENLKQLNAQINIVEDWILKNSFGKGTGWEPYPTSLRIINWIKWHLKTQGLSENGKVSLWNQVRWLAHRPEYHLLGNHLFANAKALLFASVFFSKNENSKIYKKANSIIHHELFEQFLYDGAHFELSPMYHSLAMEDLLDLINISKNLPSNFPIQELIIKYKKGMSWLKTMVYKNDELAHFNDCANKIAPTYTELLKYGKKIGINNDNFNSKKINYYKESGFIIFEDKKCHLIFDVGKIGPDYLPGHAHADTLSFELEVKGERVVVNSGTSIYGNSSERLRQRSTEAHSTVEIDSKNSSEIWSGFRVARRVRPFDINVDSMSVNNTIIFTASHNGYERMSNSPIHKRKFILTKNICTIEDFISGSANKIISRFYIHPEINIRKRKSGLVFSKNNQDLVYLKYSSLLDLEIINSTYHDEFGVNRSNKCIQIKGKTPLKTSLKIEFCK